MTDNNTSGKSPSPNQIPGRHSPPDDRNPHREKEPRSFSDFPRLDRTFLERIRTLQGLGNPGLLKNVLGLYFQEASKLLRLMREAGDRYDVKGVQQAAHALKSSSANLGATRLARICAELESLACREETAKARSLILLLEDEYSWVRSDLNAER